MRRVCPAIEEVHAPIRHVYIVLASVLLATGLAGCSSERPTGPEPSIMQSMPTRAGLNEANAIVVTNSAELVAALAPENAGRKILVRSGAYNVSQLLTVPDSATLQGEGEMLLDGSGLPAGFASGTRTTIIMTANVTGDILTLGNGASVRGIAIEELAGRLGNSIAVNSRQAGDRLSARIAEVEITNPNVHTVIPSGPSGCGITVLTLNPNLGAGPPPHESAQVSATVTQTLIHTPSTGTGCGVFAFNFAPLASVSVSMSYNVIGGGILANGGVSRPESVHDSRTVIQSRRNLYRDDSANPCVSKHTGWSLYGGSGAPVPLSVGETARNTLRLGSLDDRIEGFTSAIIAAGGRRFFALPTAGATTGNVAHLELIGTTISTPSCGGASFVADLRLAGGVVANASLDPGEDNTLRAVMRGVSGSGTRSNVYADLLGPTGALPAGTTGNKLEVAGTLRSFAQTNSAIDPAPGAQFFTGGR
jgi:hypothetical protein